MKKDCMFQFATRQKVIEDTGLITMEEANDLWKKYLPVIKTDWNELSSPQMCIWIKCNSNTDYSTTWKDIDYRDCALENGKFYRVSKERIDLDA